MKSTQSETVAHYTRKRRVAPEGRSKLRDPRAIRIGGVFLLSPLDPRGNANAASVKVVPMSRREACMELIKSAFQLDVTDPDATCASFHRVGQFASICRVDRLSYVRDFDDLPGVVNAVLESQGG